MKHQTTLWSKFPLYDIVYRKAAVSHTTKTYIGNTLSYTPRQELKTHTKT